MAGVTGLHCLSDPRSPGDPCRHYAFLVCCIPSPVIGTLPVYQWCVVFCTLATGTPCATSGAFSAFAVSTPPPVATPVQGERDQGSVALLEGAAPQAYA